MENKFGISDPSPSVTAHRSKLKVDHEPKEFKPTDFEIPHKEREKVGTLRSIVYYNRICLFTFIYCFNVAAAPKFVREEDSFMYGVCGQPVTIEFWVYGYPEPNITWFCGEDKVCLLIVT